MRYIAVAAELALEQKNGRFRHIFFNNELIIGDTTTASGAGYVIDPGPTTSDPATALMIPFDAYTSVALEKCGLNYTFFAAPDIGPGTGVLTVGNWYKVLTGPITNNSIVIPQGTRFKAGHADFTGSGTIVRPDLPDAYFDISEENYRAEAAKRAHLHRGDEATYDDVNGKMTSSNPYYFIR